MRLLSRFLSFLVFTLLVVLAPRAWSAETVTIVAPNGGETICPNHGEMVVSWSSSGLPASALINVDLYHNGTLTNHIFRNISPSPSSRKWDQMFASGATGDGYKVRINVVGSTLYDESDAAFNLAHVAPVVTMTAPKGGEQWRLGETHPVEWSWTGCIWGIRTITLSLLKEPWDPYKDTVGTLSNMTPMTAGKFDWTVGDLLGGKIVEPRADYKVQVFSIMFSPTYAITIAPDRPWLSAAPFTVLNEDGTLPAPARAPAPKTISGPMVRNFPKEPVPMTGAKAPPATHPSVSAIPPQAPVDLKVERATGSNVNLTWRSQTPLAETRGFVVECRKGGFAKSQYVPVVIVNVAPVASTGAITLTCDGPKGCDARSAKDTITCSLGFPAPLAHGATYCFRVKAISEVTSSDYAKEACRVAE